ncbi:MAG TPA: glycerol-3-phosphate responsive antiterminator [Symbiobacteriaceae bacterium]|nr:glycerol-3-phosphate responsive antiterminator [Symbiobacteriaceae bacterium]
MRTFWNDLRTSPVIPVVWDDKGLAQILRIPVAFVYLQYGSVFTLADTCARIKQVHPNARVFFHIDLAEGIAADEIGVKFVHACGCDGIVTTKPALIEAGKKEGLETVLRGFIQDSRSLKRTIQVGLRCTPDALDILPGPVLPEVMSDLTRSLSQPVLGGGLIRREAQVLDLLRIGCRGVSSSTQELWALNGTSRFDLRRSAT